MMMQTRSVSLTVLAVIAVFAFLAVSAIPAAALTIPANDDTWTGAESPGSNYDEVDGIKIRWTLVGHYRVGWLEYTLGATAVTDATFYLNNPSQTAGVPLTLQLVGDEYGFDETTLTANSAPDTSGWTDLGTWVWGPAPDSDIGWFSKDITSFYNNNLGKTVTISISSLTQTNYAGPVFEDREGTAGSTNYPYIDFTEVPEPCSLLALAAGFVGMVLRRRSR